MFLEVWHLGALLFVFVIGLHRTFKKGRIEGINKTLMALERVNVIRISDEGAIVPYNPNTTIRKKLQP